MPPPRLMPVHPVPLPPIVAMKSVFVELLSGSAIPKNEPLLCWNVSKVIPDLVSVYTVGDCATVNVAKVDAASRESFMASNLLIEIWFETAL